MFYKNHIWCKFGAFINTFDVQELFLLCHKKCFNKKLLGDRTVFYDVINFQC